MLISKRHTLPSLPNLSLEVGSREPLQRNGFPNLPSLPNLAPRVHQRTHPRVYVYAHGDPVIRLGRLGRLGRSRQDKGPIFPTSKTRVGRLGSAINSEGVTWKHY